MQSVLHPHVVFIWSKLLSFGLRILKIKIYLEDYVLYHSKKEESKVLPKFIYVMEQFWHHKIWQEIPLSVMF